jgi:hypothetical protein
MNMQRRMLASLELRFSLRQYHPPSRSRPTTTAAQILANTKRIPGRKSKHKTRYGSTGSRRPSIPT